MKHHLLHHRYKAYSDLRSCHTSITATMIIVTNDKVNTITQNMLGIVDCCDAIELLTGVGIINTGGGYRPVMIKRGVPPTSTVYTSLCAIRSHMATFPSRSAIKPSSPSLVIATD